MRTLCLGEAIVDLICRRPVASLDDVDGFVPHCGGVAANVAITAARAGAAVALAGGAGDDLWGRWLHDRLVVEHVDLRWFARAEGLRTALTFITIDERGEPTYQLYGDGMAVTVSALEGQLLDAVQDSGALFFTSATLAGPAAAKLTMAARERALELERPIVFDPSLQVGTWRDNPGRAGTVAGACVSGAFLVKCNQSEARLMTGEADPEAAAAALLAAGAKHVIVTRGVGGAILRAKGMNFDVRADPARLVSAVGAGDAFLGTLLARLGMTDFYPAALAAALPAAAKAAARACERWGALA